MSTHQAERGRQVDEREARQVAEEARETGWDQPSFGKQLFLGDFRLDLIHPHPRPGEESSRRGEEFCARSVAGILRGLGGRRADRARCPHTR